jgi:hypothetical protein
MGIGWSRCSTAAAGSAWSAATATIAGRSSRHRSPSSFDDLTSALHAAEPHRLAYFCFDLLHGA